MDKAITHLLVVYGHLKGGLDWQTRPPHYSYERYQLTQLLLKVNILLRWLFRGGMYHRTLLYTRTVWVNG
jgi:hypothetical protein